MNIWLKIHVTGFGKYLLLSKLNWKSCWVTMSKKGGGDEGEMSSPLVWTRPTHCTKSHVLIVHYFVPSLPGRPRTRTSVQGKVVGQVEWEWTLPLKSVRINPSNHHIFLKGTRKETGVWEILLNSLHVDVETGKCKSKRSRVWNLLLSTPLA